MADAFHENLNSRLPGESAQPPTRILFVNHTAILGGGEIALMNLVRYLDRNRFQPIVLLFAVGPLVEALREHAEIHIIPLEDKIAKTKKDSLGAKSVLGIGDLASILRFVWRIRRFIASQRVDLVHTNSLKADLIGGLAARLAFRPLVWHVRDRISADYLPQSVASLFRVLARYIPRHVIANSKSTLTTLRIRQDLSNAPLPAAEMKRVTVVHDGVPVEERNEPSVQSSLTTFGLIGRISPWKGQHIFLKAAADVHEHFPAARFCIIGGALFDEHAYEQEIRQLTTDLNLEDVVEFTGFCRNVAERIEGLSAVVHASTTGEPFGQVIIEGMAAAKPVIATAGGGVPEIVVDGETGILVPMGDASAMAKAMRWMIDHPSQAIKMGNAGRRRVLESFTIQRSVRNVEAVFDRILGDR